MNAPLKTVLVLLSLSIRGSAQTLGEDTCSCSPGTYEITFDFSLVCPPTNVTVGDGIEDIACLISPTGVSASNDLVPVSVEAIDILEGGENLNIIFQDELIGPFSDGDTFTYTTNIIEGASDIRKGIQFSTYALNQAGESIVNVLNIVYTNDCNVYPVIDVNQSAGWFRFTDLGPPQAGVCPISETGAPTGTPTGFPTLTPVPPTGSPTAQPVAVTSSPTSSPTTQPIVVSNSPTAATVEVTEPPTAISLDTDAPTASTVVETDSPTAQTTLMPTEGSSSVPTEQVPSSLATSAPTMLPTRSPTDSEPVGTPTAEPSPSPNSNVAPSEDVPSGDVSEDMPSGDVSEDMPSGDISEDIPSGEMSEDMPPGDFSMSMSMPMVLFDLDSLDSEIREFGRIHSLQKATRSGGSSSKSFSSKESKKDSKKASTTGSSDSLRGSKRSKRR